MDVQAKLTVFFEEPFWVGIFERQYGNFLEAAKFTFGAEPKDYDVYDVILKNWHRLDFSPPVTEAAMTEHRPNPKRVQREIRAQLSQKGVGTKAQQALKQQHEQLVSQRKTESRLKCEETMRIKFEQRQQKKKEKHKGR
jgi:signal transduction histidine kinase